MNEEASSSQTIQGQLKSSKFFCRGKTIHTEGRTIVNKVLEICKKETSTGHLDIPIKNFIKRTANYTGVSERTVHRINKEPTILGIVHSPEKHHAHPNPRKAEIDNFDRDVVRRTIEDFYLIQKKVPTINKLLPVLKEKINFSWQRTVLRKLLIDMGFHWKKVSDKRIMLIERPDIINWRANYLRTIRELRSAGGNIFYLDETWVDSNLTFGKCWQRDDIHDVIKTTKASNRLIIVHIGGENGFLEGADLIFKAGTSSGDYHGQMNAENFEKWLINKVLPKLPEKSTIVMDNAPYHGKELDKPPNKYSTKKDMIAFLTKKGVECNMLMRKDTLLTLVKANSPTQKIFRIDNLLNFHGHTVVRLPPYMCDLNAIELAWAQIKRYVRENNVTEDLSLKNLQKITQEAISQVTPDNWKGFTKRIMETEKYYWEKDNIMEDVIDSFIIDGNSSSEESDSDEILETSLNIDFEDNEIPIDFYLM